MHISLTIYSQLIIKLSIRLIVLLALQLIVNVNQGRSSGRVTQGFTTRYILVARYIVAFSSWSQSCQAVVTQMRVILNGVQSLVLLDLLFMCTICSVIVPAPVVLTGQWCRGCCRPSCSFIRNSWAGYSWIRNGVQGLRLQVCSKSWIWKAISTILQSLTCIFVCYVTNLRRPTITRRPLPSILFVKYVGCCSSWCLREFLVTSP